VPPRCDDEHHCITCSDEGVAMHVVAVDRDRGLALCQGPEGERASVETALVEPVAPGDALLVHAGTALIRLQAEALG
jgi:hydrogenase maturation factor